MNTEEIGYPIATINFKGDKKKTKTLSVETDLDKVNESFREIKLTRSPEFMQQIPNKETERSILYITGASGSGKSYYTKHYADEYKRIFPKNPIYLISSINEDSSIDKVKGLKRINLNEDFINTQFTIDDFKDTLIIFDDTDVIVNKQLKLKIQTILNIILETGRHSRTSCIFTSHLPTNGHDTRRILNEAHSITFFPNGLGGKSLKYLLDNYLGLDTEQRKKIKRLPSRWVTYVKTYPNIILYEKGAYVLNSEDD